MLCSIDGNFYFRCCCCSNEYTFVIYLHLIHFLVSSFTALETIALLTLQCARRFYETQYIQVFSSQAKINFTHYLVGYFHYFGAFLAILSQAPGFVHNPNPEDVTHIHIDLVLPRNLSMLTLFLLGWSQQLRANLMLANLRKNRTGMSGIEQELPLFDLILNINRFICRSSGY